MEKEREPQEANCAMSLTVESQIIGVEPLVLASASPRRAEILRAVGWSFRVEAGNVDETMLDGEDPISYARRLAQVKAMQVAARQSVHTTVLGADTIVVVDGKVFGKPHDEQDARRMLQTLRGRWHEVVTGVALWRMNNCKVAHERTRVFMAKMSDSEIDWYVKTNEPMDKAGAYAVQGRAALFIEAIEGDYWNVVGLPVRLVYRLASELSRSYETT